MGIFKSKCLDAEEPRPKKTAARQPNEHDRAVLQVKVARDKLSKLKKKLDAEITKQEVLARELCRQKKKDRALLVLKRRKYLTKQYEHADAELTNVKQQLATIEFAQAQNNIMRSLERGNEALKALQDEMSVEDAERIMEETAEGIAYAEELAEVVGQSIGEDDEEALQAQLDAMEMEMMNGGAADMPTVPEVPAMPKVPEMPAMPSIPADLVMAAEGKEKEQRAELQGKEGGTGQGLLLQ